MLVRSVLGTVIHDKSLAAALLTTAVYLVALVFAVDDLGATVPIGSVIPVAAWAWAYALRGGLVSGALVTLSNVEVATVMQSQPLQEWLSTGGGAGSFAILGIGLLVGWLRGTRLALERELSARLAIEIDLKRLSRLNELILASVGEGIVATGASGRVVSVNPAGARILGTSVDAAIGSSFDDLVAVDASDAAESMSGDRLVSMVLADGNKRSSEMDRLTRRDGSTIIVDRVIAPLRETAEEDVGGVVISLRDVTERLALDRSKSEFLAMTSLELRTPLTAIHATLGLLASGVLGELPLKASGMVSVASQNSDRLLRLVNEIVELERMNLGGVPLEIKEWDANELLEETGAGVGVLAAGLEVAIQVECGGGLFVKADRGRIVQTLTNLAGNAIKFSPVGGSVLLACHASPTEATFEVADSGRGLSREQANEIFEPFVQVKNSDSSELGGVAWGWRSQRGSLSNMVGVYGWKANSARVVRSSSFYR